LTDPGINLQRERARLRRFGVTIGLAFWVLGALVLWRHRAWLPIPALFGALGAALLLLAGLAPVWLRPIEWAWMKLANALGWVMTRVVLGVIFLLVFTPAGLIRRLLGKDPLELRFDHRAASYWHARTEADPSPERMEKMF
jgi:hypothetical protein